MNPTPLYNLSPALSIALFGAALALGPLVWVGWRHRGHGGEGMLRALTLVVLFLTFDLVAFGAFTRLTDSGLGCPDWPGCYGNASPLGAHAQIHSAQTLMPSGPVTWPKAWIEMIHRYLATAVGAFVTVLAAAHLLLWWRRSPLLRPALAWPLVTLLWICLQGAFGALTVTMKLYPAIVTLHLLGGLALLALLAVQAEGYARQSLLPLSPALRKAVLAAAVPVVAQVALGGWVSTNYAVLACTDFPTCQGGWWPDMDFTQGFTLRRSLGMTADGNWLPFAALTAIHYTHRLMAYVVLLALAALAWRLHADGHAAHRRWARVLAGLALWQLFSGLSNVVLGWPLLSALAHTGGAAALVVALTMLVVRTRHAASQGQGQGQGQGQPAMSVAAQSVAWSARSLES